MFKKLFHSALWGLAAAGVILFAVPKLNNSSLFSADDIVSFNSAVRIASPAVVNVYNRSFSSASINDSDQLQVNNLGSGVIMTKDGYILTNKHVIQNADQIVVALQNGNIYEANLIGSDNLTDLAVQPIFPRFHKIKSAKYVLVILLWLLVTRITSVKVYPKGLSVR